MGNQESISPDTYIIKKKIIKKNTKPLNQEQQFNKPMKRDLKNNNNQPLRNDNSNNNQSMRYDNNNNNNTQSMRYDNSNQFIRNDNNQFQRYDNNQPLRHDNNNQLVERNILLDTKCRVIDYPTNSNNELSIPKKSFDNVKFTPFNINDEVSKFNKNIDNEREEFNNSEKERRKKFEDSERDKKEYLNKQIKYFEENYNPWEILGLEYNDYNINNIKKAYKRNALKYHPDKVGSEYNDKFQLITQSYIYLLGKSEEKNSLDIKINKKVEKSEYDTDIVDKVENIYIDKDNFNINSFNTIFDKYKLPSSFDKGYSNLSHNNEEEQIFNKKFNNDIFNEHFDNIKTKKIGNEIIEYYEPEALDTSINNANQTFFGMEDINDFGSMNNNNLSYTDYKKAHIDENLLIDVSKVKYKKYNSIDQLESDRSNISYNMSNDDKKRYDNLERKRLEDDSLRLRTQQNYDQLIEKQYSKINQKLLVSKK